MHAFWSGYGLEPSLISRMAQRAEKDGGIWGDPEALTVRIFKVLEMTSKGSTSLSLDRLLRHCHEALYKRPEELQSRIETLHRLLPGEDVLRTVALDPSLLRYSEAWLEQRIGLALHALPRRDMLKILAKNPRILKIQPPELAERARVIHSAYVGATIVGWDPKKAAEMLQIRSELLARILMVNAINPGIRTALGDMKIVRMKEADFYQRFEKKRRQRRYRNAAATAAELRPRRRTPFGDILDVPTSGNIFEWGREMAAARAEQHEALTAAELQTPGTTRTRERDRQGGSG